MLLYHGTSAIRANSAKTDGIRPRTDYEGNWPNRPSRSDCVYLTKSFGATFAINASKKDKEPKDAECAIIEVEIADDALLLPDEDFLTQCVLFSYQQRKQRAAGRKNIRKAQELSKTGGKKLNKALLSAFRHSLEEYADTNWLRQLRKNHKDKPICDWVDTCATKDSGEPTKGWEASLFGLGTCAFKGTIPPTMIRRVAYFVRSHPVLQDFTKYETSVSWYRNYHGPLSQLNEWVFGDRSLLEIPQGSYAGIRVEVVGELNDGSTNTN